MKIRIGSRRSHLARVQAFSVGEALQRLGHKIDYEFKESLGDKNLTDPLWKMPERGVFTEDFVEDLRKGKIDLVVHSWKDLPTQARADLAILGTLPRADCRDLFFLKSDSTGKSNLEILTSSPRRTFSSSRQLASLLPFPVETLNHQAVRGNVITRLKKLVEGNADGMFMAKAALDRLLDSKQEDFIEAQKEIRQYLEKLKWMVLPLSLFPTAPAQGALAIEGMENREDLRTALAPIHCPSTARLVQKERALFSSFGGGCHQKIGLTVQEHPRLGDLEFFYGQLDSGEVRHWMKAEKSPPHEKNASRWPLKAAPAFFRREPLAVKPPCTDLFVSRAEALPDSWELGDSLLWSAGVESWQKLAARGIWVNGCSDSLGEEVPALDALAGRRTNWTKLTHDRSRNHGKFPLLATYRLEEKEFSLPLVEQYFWMSETSFQRALELQPGIKDAKHACGPGYTAEVLEKILDRPPEVYINYRHWISGNPLKQS